MTLNEQRIIEHEISEREKFIEGLTQERKQIYKSVQDMAKADAVTTDKAIERMRKIDIMIRAHEKEINLREGKLKLARRD